MRSTRILKAKGNGKNLLEAKGNGKNFLEILVAGGWANTKIFAKYYDKKLLKN